MKFQNAFVLSGYKRKTHNLNHIFKMVITIRMKLRMIMREEREGGKRILGFLMCFDWGNDRIFVHFF